LCNNNEIVSSSPSRRAAAAVLSFHPKFGVFFSPFCCLIASLPRRRRCLTASTPHRLAALPSSSKLREQNNPLRSLETLLV
ncbi:hypothetical protein A2U01_0041175, partial [Trifolium medium]|nr:hypothetical protein [Trifolium medium]